MTNKIKPAETTDEDLIEMVEKVDEILDAILSAMENSRKYLKRVSASTNNLEELAQLATIGTFLAAFIEVAVPDYQDAKKRQG